MTHSPKPWTIGDSGIIYDADANEVACIFGSTADEIQANARLIAAAPELLAELCEYVAEHGDNCDCGACRAIAKATGSA